MDSPLVSIILPAYNGAAYLAEAVRSCLDQTHKELELVVVDDGSTDSTAKLMEYFTKLDSRVSYYLKADGPSGTAKALNYGMERAKGEVFMFAAADDVQLPEKVAIGLEAIEGADIGYSGYYHCNPKAEIWDYCRPLPLTLENIKANRACSGGALVLRRSVFEKTPFREMPVNEDMAILVDAFKAKYRYGFVDKPSFKYRLLKEGISYSRKAEVDRSTEELIKELDDAAQTQDLGTE